MPQYRYIAYDGNNRQRGVDTAESPTALAEMLRSRGYRVTSVQQVSPGGSQPLFGSGKLSLGDKITLTQNLATFLRSGVPIVRALELTAAEASPRLATVLEGISSDLRSGQSLAAS